MRAAAPLFLVCTAVCLSAHVAIVRSVLRSRSARASTDVPQPKLAIEILWALLPAVALAFLLGATWVRVRQHTGHPPVPAVEVNAVA